MLQDTIVALRTFAKRPGYAASVILTLALGIGATVMMFGLVDAALLRPLPFHQPDKLVLLTGVAGPQRSPRGASFPEVADWRRHNATLEDVAIYDDTSLNLRVGNEAVRVDAELVSAPYFPLLGATAAQGRTFLPSEETAGAEPVAVVSDRLWRERLGGAPNLVDSTIVLNDRSVRIVGIMPAGFAGVAFDTDVWIPSTLVTLSSAPTILQDRGSRYLLAIGRLKPGVPQTRAQEDLTRVARLLELEFPDTNRERGVDVDDLRTALLGDTGGQVRSLFGAVLLFLAVSAANAAGLQVVRATARRRELALRFALGARRWHVLRQLLVESWLLSLAAGVLGALIATWVTGAAVAVLPQGALPIHVQPRVDPRALAFTFGLAAIVGIAIAGLTAGAASRANLIDAMKQGGRTLDSTLGAIRRPSTQQLLVALEIAAAMVLLTLAGLVVRSLERQSRVDLGFDPAQLTVARLTLPASRYPIEQRIAFVESLERSLANVPGVRAHAIASDLPLMGASSAAVLTPDTVSRPEGALRFYRHIVTPEFFRTMDIRIVAGRGFSRDDRRGAPLVAIVNDAAARRIWGSADPVGRRFHLGRTADGPRYEVVGVAATARFRSLTGDLDAANAEPDVYFAYGQSTSTDLQIALRAAGSGPVSLASVRDAVARIDAGLPLFQFQRMEEVVRLQTSAVRFVSAMLSVFSACALLLASVGLYTLVSYVVSLSRAEIAIRLALGADRRRIIALIVRNSMAVVGVGVALGGVGAYAAGRAVEAQLFQVGAADPATFAGVAVVLLAVTLIASLVPTRLAVRVSPQSALRE
jgi:predicted permease